MTRGEIGGQQAQYRRGLVLGLTVAESMLLILFALLLALSFVLVQRDREVAALSARISGLGAKDRLLDAKVQVLSAIVAHQPTDQFFSELVRARQLQAEVEKQRSDLVERERKVGRLEAVLTAVAGSPDQRRKLLDLAALGARVRTGQSPEATLATLEGAQAAARDEATLRGQVAQLRGQLRAVGHGGDYPSCWVTPDGEIQYLFDISLNGAGTLSVADAAPGARTEERRELPIPPTLVSGAVTRGDFLAMTRKLLDLSNAKACRYYVIARDRTGPTQKDLFKTLMIGTVEARFYKVIRP